MYQEQQIKDDIIKVGEMLYDKGLLIGKDGNLSVKSGDIIYITASGFCKGKLKREHISKINLQGELLEGLIPARDIRMHLAVYEECPEVSAIVHAHPPIITGYSMSDISYDKIALPEVYFTLGDIGATDYSTPTTIEVPQEIKRVLREKKNCHAIILSNHGALTMSNDIFEAFYQMETLEMYAKANLVSRILGKTKYLNEDQMNKVMRLMAGEKSEEVV